jgi:hypothetical protein
MLSVPIPSNPSEETRQSVAECVGEIQKFTREVRSVGGMIEEWLQVEFGLDKPGAALVKPHELDADAFAAAVRKALPRSRKLSAADIQRLKEEHRQTVEPARIAAAEAQALERRLSDLVNTAYGLTPEEVRLMWTTAPPRMPFTP